MERPKIKLPIVVEGRYDKSTLLSFLDATVIMTNGFAIFNSKEKRALIKKLASVGGIIVLTDSDAGGRQIRSFLSGILPKDRIFNLYIPRIAGKEKRKSSPSKEGMLGVEGMDRDILLGVLAPFVVSSDGACHENETQNDRKVLTKLEFYTDGFSGRDNSSEKRRALAKMLGFPEDMSANSLIEAINIAVGYDEYKRLAALIFQNE